MRLAHHRAVAARGAGVGARDGGARAAARLLVDRLVDVTEATQLLVFVFVFLPNLPLALVAVARVRRGVPRRCVRTPFVRVVARRVVVARGRGAARRSAARSRAPLAS